jgi:type III secretion system FlhB-like substrate exporter
LQALAEILDFSEPAMVSAFLVLIRVGTVTALLPGFGEQSIPMRIRLLVALAFTAIVWPVVSSSFTATLQDMPKLMLTESNVGFLVGISIRLIVMALQLAGSIAAQSTSIAQVAGSGATPDPMPAIGNILVMIGLARSSPAAMAGMTMQVLVDLLIVICILAILVGAVDFIWRKFNHQKKLRMSFQDLKDEGKEAEGGPHTKAQRRQRGRDIATNRMLVEVPKADVIVVNPTHFAVALKWSNVKGSALVCVAKGEDEIAARIREIASQSGVPIHSDPPTARAIHATTKIGDEITPDQYRAVAAALRFAEIMRKKAREDGLNGSK